MASASSARSPPSLPLPRILIVDHFDSYTLNLLSLLSHLCASDDELSQQVVVLPHTHSLLSSQQSFEKHLLPYFDAVVLSPGPGSPHNEADFGFGLHFLGNAHKYHIPALGVCLGHQGLAVAFGGTVKRARSIQHGIVSRLNKTSSPLSHSIFANVPEGTNVTRYNSLTVDPDDLPECLEITATSTDLDTTAQAPLTASIHKLIESRATSPHVVSRHESIQGLAHKTLPLWGVQFHPESIESQNGTQILANFIAQVRLHQQRNPSRTPSSSSTQIPSSIRKEAQRYIAGITAPPQSSTFTQPAFRIITHQVNLTCPLEGQEEDAFSRLFRSKNARTGAPTASIWLDSARKGDPQSRKSYMARPAFSMSYNRHQSQVDVEILQGPTEGARCQIPLSQQTTFWDYMDALQTELQTSVQIISSPPHATRASFRTGFVGYWGYEMKSESLGLLEGETISRASTTDGEAVLPDAQFLFCDAVLQIDHEQSSYEAVVLERLDPGDSIESPHLTRLRAELHEQGVELGHTSHSSSQWIDHLTSTLHNITTVRSCTPERTHYLPTLRSLDSASDYKSKVEAARALIAQGESYELCMTTQFVGQCSLEEYKDHFELYRTLRARNPAPYAAYIELPPCSGSSKLGRAILSSSPERFLSQSSTGAVEMKPIKGTLPRAGFGIGDAECISLHGPAWIQAEDTRRRNALQADPKERAENLMIVDLIRADLLSFCRPSSVQVPLLIKVESYTSVHQLVTTVVGQTHIPPVQALKRCFPPGSMTGAPKRRSVTLLERLEGKSRCKEEESGEWTMRHRPRGVYAGCLGYLSLDGSSDFSVVIRTAVVDEEANVTVGAGGAITYLSEAEKEWQEVLHKVKALGGHVLE